MGNGDEPSDLVASPAPARWSILRPPPRWAAVLIWAALIAAVAFARLVLLPSKVLPIAYGVPLILCVWFASRRLLWGMVAAFTGLTLYKFQHVTADPNFPGTTRWLAWALIEFDMLVIAGVLHVLIGARHHLGHRRLELEAANRNLAAREAHIAAQHADLQRNNEELERQGEELRVTNEELAAREHTLEGLLDLAHSLTADLTRPQLVSRLCDGLTALLRVPGATGAILERRGAELAVLACHGAGEVGADPIPWASSFAALVIERGQTAYLEDVTLRPDLRIPQPKDGGAHRSVLATPLRVHGQPVGTVELYSPDRRAWARHEIALIEALAAQASISLENLRLFEEIDEQRRRLETTFRTLPVGVVIANADFTDVRMNPAGAALVGESPDANFAHALLAGNKWQVTRNGRPLHPAELPLLRALHEGREVRGEELGLTLADGRHVDQLVSAAPILDRAGGTLGAICAFVDITTHKALQGELDRRRRDAEEMAVRKTRFLAAVSHDIRTPANAINLLAELLGRVATSPDLAAEVPEMARELQDSAASLVRLVSDVLDVTRFDYGRVELQESVFPLADLLDEHVGQLRPLADAKQLGVECPTPPPGLRLKADRVKLGRVLANLIGNAIKFTDEGGRVQIAADPLGDEDGGGLRLSVRDSGVGIAAENLDRVFDEFFQIKNPARDKSKGTGLGLAICKRLVDAMGGRIAADSDLGHGSTFTVTLPASAVVPALPPAAERPAAGLAPRPGRDGKGNGAAVAVADHAAVPAAAVPRPLAGLRVLVVEDHETTRSATAQILTSEGATVAQAQDGRAALRLLDQSPPQVLLLDMMLPDMDGREVLRRVARQRPPGLRGILVMTGDVAEERGAEARALGADALMHKPVDLPAVVAFLRGYAAPANGPA